MSAYSPRTHYSVAQKTARPTEIDGKRFEKRLQCLTLIHIFVGFHDDFTFTLRFRRQTQAIQVHHSTQEMDLPKPWSRCFGALLVVAADVSTVPLIIHHQRAQMFSR